MQSPPVREVLRVESNDISDSILPSICSIQLDERKDEELLKGVLGDDKITYSVTAEINSNIIDGGLEIPTQIYQSPEEALNLQLFEPEIRTFVKKIFLDKYPQVVSLHALDAGDVSKTLGFTALRLIPGESLPRHRRIYQLSPQDVNYLEDLIEQFIRFN